MSDPLSKIKQFIADNAASRELAHLAMERNKRRGIKPPVIHDGRSIHKRTKGMKGFIDRAIEDHQARKKANSD